MKVPFRLGCTSYVYPADLLSNVERCAPLFDDIEIVLFESDNVSNFPTPSDIQKLGEWGRAHQTTFTIHFPIDCKAGALDTEERVKFQEQALRIVELFEPIDPYAYILHLEGIAKEAKKEEVDAWKRRARETCHRLLDVPGLAPEKIAVENLAYPHEWHHVLVRECGFSFCLDIGHLFRYGADWYSVCRKLLPETRVIHLHGWNGTHDHVSLLEQDQAVFTKLFPLLQEKYTGVVTLELFEEKATFDSKQLVETLCP